MIPIFFLDNTYAQIHFPVFCLADNVSAFMLMNTFDTLMEENRGLNHAISA